jgi:hypothetical protein
VVEARENLPWVTGDHPVVRLNFNSLQEFNFQAGWGTKNANIFLPLSPHHLLITQVGTNHRFRAPLPLEIAMVAQNGVIRQSMRWVFASAPQTFVGELRPRVVDAVRFAAEKEAWEDFHNRQSESELAPSGSG